MHGHSMRQLQPSMIVVLTDQSTDASCAGTGT
jgi:hypothetical protein